MNRNQLKKWIRGIVGGAISSAAAVVSVIVADPIDFNPASAGGAGRLLFVFSIAAATGAALYLKNHPLPDEDADGVPLPLCPTCGRPVASHEGHV